MAKNDKLLDWARDETTNLPAFTKNGKTICFSATTGIIQDIAHKTETHVSGGGGHIRNGHGRIDAISTTTNTTDTVFVKMKDGTETSYDLINLNIPMRTGHKVSMVSMQNGKRSTLASLMNHDLKQHHLLGDEADIVVKLRLASFLGKIKAALGFASLSFLASFFVLSKKTPELNFLIIFVMWFAIPAFLTFQVVQLIRWKRVLSQAVSEFSYGLFKAG